MPNEGKEPSVPREGIKLFKGVPLKKGYVNISPFPQPDFPDSAPPVNQGPNKVNPGQ